MKPQNGNMRFGRGASGGFSLVEIAVAVGLFAFGVVGVIGLFPAALAQRADAARDTRARIIAEDVFDSLRGSSELMSKSNKIFLPRLINMDKDDSGEDKQLKTRDEGDFPFVIGYGELGTTAVRVIPGRDAWDAGTGNNSTLSDTIYVALLTREPTATPSLYKVEVQVGFPAKLPANKRRNVAFTSLVQMP